jgi:hypothetical protein
MLARSLAQSRKDQVEHGLSYSLEFKLAVGAIPLMQRVDRADNAERCGVNLDFAQMPALTHLVQTRAVDAERIFFSGSNKRQSLFRQVVFFGNENFDVSAI